MRALIYLEPKNRKGIDPHIRHHTQYSILNTQYPIPNTLAGDFFDFVNRNNRKSSNMYFSNLFAPWQETFAAAGDGDGDGDGDGGGE